VSLLLAGDIGGTKTALVVVSPQAGPAAPVAEATFHSAEHAGLEDVVQAFLDLHPLPVDRACFGVAGPVVEGNATITNLPWVISEARLRDHFHLSKVRLINDLVAVAHAVPHLVPKDLHTLNVGERVPGGAMAVIAPGTGLGEAFLTSDGTRYRAAASEGGHADFAPTTPLERDLLAYMWREHPHVSNELVCSGLGLPHIYTFLKTTGYAEEPRWLAEELAQAADSTPVIVNAGSHKRPPSKLAAGALETFVSILGAEAGNLALKVLATGGVYLGGGIPPRILGVLGHGGFMRAFTHKGRMSDLMMRMPVHVIVLEGTALMGAASAGLDL
jgi:glucokinase